MKMVSIAVIIVLVSTVSVYADEIKFEQNMEVVSECGVMKAYYFESPKTVSRYECLNAIMRAIGVVEDSNGNGGRHLLVSDWGGKVSDRCYWDGYDGYLVGSNGDGLYIVDGHPLMINENGTIHDDIKYLERGKTGINYAFAYGIAEGEFYNGRRYFYFERAVTLSEAMLFMMRCLEDLKLNDGVEVLEKAEMCGLITKEDSFYGKGDKKLTPEEFSTLMVRFLNQPRHYYFVDERSGQEFYEDKTGNMTYLEYLTTRKIYEG